MHSVGCMYECIHVYGCVVCVSKAETFCLELLFTQAVEFYRSTSERNDRSLLRNRLIFKCVFVCVWWV